jgi:hypothetical protein
MISIAAATMGLIDAIFMKRPQALNLTSPSQSRFAVDLNQILKFYR